MRAIVPVLLIDTMLVSHTVAEPDLGAAWGAYNSGTTYNEAQRVTSGGKVYQSRQGLNLNKPLPVSPITQTLWWSEVTEAAYAAGTTYALGARVISAETHRMYESAQAANLGKPLPIPPETATAWWTEIGTTNRWACLDVSRNTQTVTTSPLTVVINPGVRVNSIALMGCDCDTATITTSTGYSVTKNMAKKPAINWYEYFFDPFLFEKSLIRFDIPPDSGMTITVTLTKASSPIRLGSIVVGNSVYLGATEYQAVSDADNYSTITRDLFGNATLIPRRSLPKNNVTTRLDKPLVNKARAARTALNAVPTVWCGLDDLSDDDYYEAILIVGVYKRFSIVLDKPMEARLTLELEEI